MVYLAEIREEAGQLEAAERFLENAGPNAMALEKRAQLRAKAGDLDASRTLLEQAAELGSTDAMKELTQLLEDHSADTARIRELRERIAESEKILTMLREASRNLELARQMLAKLEEEMVSTGSANEEEMLEVREVLRPSFGEESLWHTIVLGRIEKNLGFVDSARARFSRALDAGSMDDQGNNRLLAMLAEIMRESGNTEIAKRLTKYGLELDGTVSQPWTVSISQHNDYP